MMSMQSIGRPMEILLVEDNLVQARLTMESVDRCEFRHRTTLVCDGAEALDFIFCRGIFRRAPRPDLILLDLRLPKVDGVEVLAQVKADHDLASIPIVVMTSSGNKADRQQCEQHQVASYLTKPVDLEQFVSLLKRLKAFWHEDMILPQAVR